MEAALRLLLDAPKASLRILEIGGGVIEPLLLAALVRRIAQPGVACTIRAIDPSPDCHTLLSAITAGHSYVGPSGLAYDANRGRLLLPALARTFSAPECPINPHLSDPELLTQPLKEMQDLGLLGLLGLPESLAEAAHVLREEGLPVPAESVALIRPEQRGVLDLSPEPAPYDLVIANFSIQYPIMEGHAVAVAERLLSQLAPQGILLHGATYGAQVRLFHALAERGPWEFVFGVRELDAVSYHDDAAGAQLRLRIRTDALLRRPGRGALAPAVFAGPLPCSHTSPSFAEVVARMDPMDGLLRPELAAALWSTETGAAGWWSTRQELLAAQQPLRCRIEWRPARPVTG
jgi:hypothetical protein